MQGMLQKTPTHEAGKTLLTEKSRVSDWELFQCHILIKLKNLLKKIHLKHINSGSFFRHACQIFFKRSPSESLYENVPAVEEKEKLSSALSDKYPAFFHPEREGIGFLSPNVYFVSVYLKVTVKGKL